jgi:hypothetical protein
LGQREHAADAFPASKRPAAQLSQAVSGPLPTRGWAKPAGHSVQEVAPALGAYAPAPQHALKPAGVEVPAGQVAQCALALLPAGPVVPRGHVSEQLAWPERGSNRPARHAMQEVACPSSGWAQPSGHAVHALLASS